MLEEKIKEIINMENTFIGDAPLDVDDCQWIRAASGNADLYFAKDSFVTPQYIIGVRSKKQTDARNIIQLIYARLQQYVEETRIGLIITRLPTYVGRDDKYRSVYTMYAKSLSSEY